MDSRLLLSIPWSSFLHEYAPFPYITPPNAPATPTTAAAEMPMTAPGDTAVGCRQMSAGLPIAPSHPLAASHTQAVYEGEPVAPPVLEFAGQGLHSIGPRSVFHVSTAHAAQASAGTVISPVNPAAQRHSVTAVAPSPSVVESAGHARQGPAPVPSLYVATPHASHVTSGPVMSPSWPALHKQSVIAVDPTAAVQTGVPQRPAILSGSTSKLQHWPEITRAHTNHSRSPNVTAFSVHRVHGPGPGMPSHVPIAHASQMDAGVVNSFSYPCSDEHISYM